MGNCVFKGLGVVGSVVEDEEEMVKVVTTNGGIMELCPPITAECITNEFPGHAIYRSRDIFSKPLLHNEDLHVGQPYYLLPLNRSKRFTKTTAASNSNPSNPNNDHNSSSSTVRLTPYRMSYDSQKIHQKRPTGEAAHEVFPRYNSCGVWKVKLVISPEQLAEILAQEARTEELIESVRTVAKCGNNGVSMSSSSSVANSDKWSVSSSWKGLYERNGLEAN